MELIQSITELKKAVEKVRGEGKNIGLVPTMGALHEGHLALVKRARNENDIVICSIFVNPTQFNNAEDLQKYPRTLTQDLALLSEYADFVFAPSVEEVYREPATEQYNFGALEAVMEGPARPGHFNGVGIIVGRLFKWILPDRAYFGEKDFQQLVIIKELVKQLQMAIEVVGCPIVREQSGLALSSRNQHLSDEERQKAANINRILKESALLATRNTEEIKHFVEMEIAKIDTLRLEYYEIADAETLQPIRSMDDAKTVVGCIVVYAGNTRLIDNIRYK